MKKLLPFLAATLLAPSAVFAQGISSVLAHPVFQEFYSCAEHWDGQLKAMGDALGTDCAIQRLVSDHGRVWMRAYSGSGRKNEDWYGWGMAVLSPCTCEVVKANENPRVNQPGILGKPPASFLMLKRDDGVFFVLAHVTKSRVGPGDKVEAGQVVAQVGNNGYSRQPHIHIGAWRNDDEPLQIRFDQVRMRELFEAVAASSTARAPSTSSERR